MFSIQENKDSLHNFEAEDELIGQIKEYWIERISRIWPWLHWGPYFHGAFGLFTFINITWVKQCTLNFVYSCDLGLRLLFCFLHAFTTLKKDYGCCLQFPLQTLFCNPIQNAQRVKHQIMNSIYLYQQNASSRKKKCKSSALEPPFWALQNIGVV